MHVKKKKGKKSKLRDAVSCKHYQSCPSQQGLTGCKQHSVASSPCQAGCSASEETGEPQKESAQLQRCHLTSKVKKKKSGSKISLVTLSESPQLSIKGWSSAVWLLRFLLASNHFPFDLWKKKLLHLETFSHSQCFVSLAQTPEAKFRFLFLFMYLFLIRSCPFKDSHST